MAAPYQLVGHALRHYRIIEQIGAGGMGVVYRARDEQLERDVAIKVLPAGTLADDAARKRFRKEALALAKLNHPNIATIFEFSSQNSTDYLVTEYISGLALDRKSAAGALSEKEVVGLGIQLAVTPSARLELYFLCFAFHFAHRAFCARLIFARAFADSFRRLRVDFDPYTPMNAVSAASNAES